MFERLWKGLDNEARVHKVAQQWSDGEGICRVSCGSLQVFFVTTLEVIEANNSRHCIAEQKMPIFSYSSGKSMMVELPTE